MFIYMFAHMFTYTNFLPTLKKKKKTHQMENIIEIVFI